MPVRICEPCPSLSSTSAPSRRHRPSSANSRLNSFLFHMSSTTDQRLKATFQDAIRRPDRAPTAHAVEHGPTAGRRPDRSLFILPIDRIRPDQDQVRTRNKSVTDAEVRELAESIKAVGIENPLTVRYLADQDVYQLIAGERRYTAAKLAGLAEVPVKLVDADEATVRRHVREAVAQGDGSRPRISRTARPDKTSCFAAARRQANARKVARCQDVRRSGQVSARDQ